MEIWKPVTIEGYEDLYQVSTIGRVRSNKKGKVKMLKISKCPEGYMAVGLNNDGIFITHKVHRLVALAFLDNPCNLPVVDHINRIRDDNRLENLRWASYSQNSRNRPRISKYQGVCFDKRINKWKAQIKSFNNNKIINLGTFDAEDDAGIAFRTYIIENNLVGLYCKSEISNLFLIPQLTEIEEEEIFVLPIPKKYWINLYEGH